MSGLRKNVAGQKWRVFAFDATTNAPKTGDAANITAKIALDWGAAGAVTDTNPTETEDGYYLFDLTQAETNADVLDIYPESSTADIEVIGVPGTVYTLSGVVFKNQAFSNLEFLMVLASDGRTPATGLTVTGQRSIDGGAFASISGSIAEVSNGIYQADLLAADTNGSVITYRFSAATADDKFITVKTT